MNGACDETAADSTAGSTGDSTGDSTAGSTDAVGTAVADVQRRFGDFARTTDARAPLYAHLSRLVADRADLAGILLTAPPPQQLPVLLFAAVHRLLLDHRDDRLAQWYPNLTHGWRSPDGELDIAFGDFVTTHVGEIRALVAARSTQTNEVGRCAVLLPAVELIADEVGTPVALVDVGTSGGLNLLLDRFAYRYRWVADGTTVAIGQPSPVELAVDVRGDMPTPRAIVPIAARLGIDREPIDVADPGEARWLEACVWPDQADRFRRLVAAIELFREMRPPVRRADAVDGLADAVAEVAVAGHPIVTNTWVLNYLTPERRRAYLDRLDELGGERDLSWIYAEAPALVPELPTEPDPRDPELTVLTLVRWRQGRRTVEHLATCHPHGYWIHWR